MSRPGEDNTPTRLRVLPSSGKAEQLRRETAIAGATDSPPASSSTNAATADQKALVNRVVEVLRTVYDPELPLNIYDLGLIYAIDVDDAGSVRVRMTLTTPGCPVAGTLPGEVQRKVASVEGVSSADVQLVWDPPWTKDRLSEAAKLELGLL